MILVVVCLYSVCLCSCNFIINIWGGEKQENNDPWDLPAIATVLSLDPRIAPFNICNSRDVGGQAHSHKQTTITITTTKIKKIHSTPIYFLF